MSWVVRIIEQNVFKINKTKNTKNKQTTITFEIFVFKVHYCSTFCFSDIMFWKTRLIYWKSSSIHVGHNFNKKVWDGGGGGTFPHLVIFFFFSLFENKTSKPLMPMIHKCPHTHTVIQQILFYMHQPTDRITHTMAFVTPDMEHWLEREGSIWWPITPLMLFCLDLI